MDTGTAIVVVAVLIFYLRLIILQRERLKRNAQAPVKKSRKGKAVAVRDSYGIISRNPRNRAIAGIGLIGVILGLLLASGWLPAGAAQAYWWIPTTLGLLLFSVGFGL